MAGRTCAMGFEAFTYHGGALEVARRLAPDAPTPWIDLSTGINPYPYPVPDLTAEAWTRLPDCESLAELEAAAAARYRASAASVVAGPGSQALIQALARLWPARRVCALTPTYGGFDEAFAAAGMPVEHAASLDALKRADVAIVVNPNNPDGRLSPRAELLDLHARLAPRGGMLIVDEAFADFDGAAESLSPALPASSAVVLRSFGKAYGLAGLRLGFAIASPDIAGRLRGALGPWPISGPAIAIGSRALADSDWLGATRATTRQGQSAARRPSGAGGLSHPRRNASVFPRRTRRRQRGFQEPACGGHSRAPLRWRARSAAVWHSSRRGGVATARGGARKATSRFGVTAKPPPSSSFETRLRRCSGRGQWVKSQSLRLHLGS